MSDNTVFRLSADTNGTNYTAGFVYTDFITNASTIWNPTLSLPALPKPQPKPEDEIAWLRRRVDEYLWKPA